MICSESCNLQPDGTLFRGRHQENEDMALCVGSEINRIPILKKIETVMDLTSKANVMSWKDVTAECEAEETATSGLVILHQGRDIAWEVGYRLTKISGPLQPHVAFIVEKRA